MILIGHFGSDINKINGIIFHHCTSNNLSFIQFLRKETIFLLFVIVQRFWTSVMDRLYAQS